MYPLSAVKRCFRNGKLTTEEKLMAVQRVKNGETKASVSRDINVPESTLRGWYKNADKLKFLSERDSANKKSTDEFAANLSSSVVNKQANTSNEWHPLQSRNKSIALKDSDGVVDLTVLDERQQNSRRYGFTNNHNTDQMKNGSNLTSSSSEPFYDSVYNSGPWTHNQTVGTTTDPSKKPNNSISQPWIGFNSFHHPMPSHTLNLPVPPLPIIPTASGSNDAKESMLLWQLHDFNQSVIERIAGCSSANKSATNFRLPDGLNISATPVVQPIENSHHDSVKLSTPKAPPKSEPIVNRKQDAINEYHDNNNNNNNNNCIAANNKENCTEIVDASEAMKYAEKFSRWVQTYSDPTLTHQDVLRFEQLLGKVRKIVERRNNDTVQNMKIRRRK